MSSELNSTAYMITSEGQYWCWSPLIHLLDTNLQNIIRSKFKIQNSDGCAPGHKFMASPEKNETISYFGNERRVDGLLAASSAYLISIGLNSSFMSRNGNGPSPDQG